MKVRNFLAAICLLGCVSVASAHGSYGFFYDDGNVYVMKAANVLAGDRYGKKICRKIISRYQNAEIDDAYDFWLLEKILEKQMTEGIE